MSIQTYTNMTGREMKDETIGDRVKALRGERSQEEVARYVGVKRASVSQWESGKTKISHKNLRKLAEFFSVSMSYLIDGEGVVKDEEEEHWGKERVKRRKIHVLTWEQVALGRNTVMNGTEESIDYFGDEDVSGYFALPVRGDTMDPEFSHGELVIVDSGRKPQTGDYAVVVIGDSDEAALKQYMKDGESTFLKSANSRYPMIDCTEKKLQVLGVVVQKVKRYI